MAPNLTLVVNSNAPDSHEQILALLDRTPADPATATTVPNHAYQDDKGYGWQTVMTFGCQASKDAATSRLVLMGYLNRY